MPYHLIFEEGRVNETISDFFDEDEQKENGGICDLSTIRWILNYNYWKMLGPCGKGSCEARVGWGG